MSDLKTRHVELSDAALVVKCQEELPYITDAYEVLVMRYDALIFQFCLRYLRSRSDSEEVVQDVFLRVFHHIRRFEGRASFKTWLITIARNQCSRRYAKLKRRTEMEEVYGRQELVTAQQDNPREAEREGLATQVLDEMRIEDREILSLRHLTGLTLVEVSQVLEISASAAKMRHLRAAARFQELFERKRRDL